MESGSGLAGSEGQSCWNIEGCAPRSARHPAWPGPRSCSSVAWCSFHPPTGNVVHHPQSCAAAGAIVCLHPLPGSLRLFGGSCLLPPPGMGNLSSAVSLHWCFLDVSRREIMWHAVSWLAFLTQRCLEAQHPPLEVMPSSVVCSFFHLWMVHRPDGPGLFISSVRGRLDCFHSGCFE